MTEKDKDRFIEACDIVCGVCYARQADTCNNCPVRFTIDEIIKEK